MKLSVIIPIYNVQDYLAACLDSVIAPGSTDYEIIAVNDGSTDGSPAVLADYAERFPGLVKTVTTPNGGLGHARNVGISLARGEYLLFLDSDDTLSPGAIREILGALDGSFDIGVFDFVSVDREGRVLRYYKGCENSGSFSLSAYPAFLLSPPNAVNKLWRRALFIDSGISFPDRKWFEDLATIPRLYLRSGTIRTLPHPWYRYLQRDGSITRNTDAARNLEMLDAIETVMTDYVRSGAFGKYHRELEAMAAYHELLTSSTRVNLIDPKRESHRPEEPGAGRARQRLSCPFSRLARQSLHPRLAEKAPSSAQSDPAQAAEAPAWSAEAQRGEKKDRLTNKNNITEWLCNQHSHSVLYFISLF